MPEKLLNRLFSLLEMVKSLKKQVISTVKRIYSGKFKCSMIKAQAFKISEADNSLNNLYGIYRQRNRYKLHWAFENAELTFKSVYLDIIETKLIPRCAGFKKKSKILKEIRELKLAQIKEVAQMQRLEKRFSILSTVITVADLVVLLALIFLVTFVSHMGEIFLHSFLLNIGFLGLLTAVKVVVDLYVISPRVDKWGWKLYKEEVDKLKKSLATLIAVSICEDEMLKSHCSAEEIVGTFEKGIQRMP